jgi:hypothetical protein
LYERLAEKGLQVQGGVGEYPNGRMQFTIRGINYDVGPEELDHILESDRLFDMWFNRFKDADPKDSPKVNPLVSEQS